MTTPKVQEVMITLMGAGYSLTDRNYQGFTIEGVRFSFDEMEKICRESKKGKEYDNCLAYIKSKCNFS